MFAHEACKKKNSLVNVRGDGKCPEHGRFAFYRKNLKEHCPACASKKNICQICGEPVRTKNPETGEWQ